MGVKYAAKANTVAIPSEWIKPNTAGMGFKEHCMVMDKVFKMSYAERIEKFATSEQKKMIADAIAEHPDCKITEYSNA